MFNHRVTATPHGYPLNDSLPQQYSSSTRTRKRKRSENSEQIQTCMGRKQAKVTLKYPLSDTDQRIIRISRDHLPGDNHYVSKELKKEGVELTIGQVRYRREQLGIANQASRRQALIPLKKIEDFIHPSNNLEKKASDREILDVVFKDISLGAWKIARELRQRKFKITSSMVKRWLNNHCGSAGEGLNTNAKRKKTLEDFKAKRVTIEQILVRRKPLRPSKDD